jgi:hypothetical protein
MPNDSCPVGFAQEPALNKKSERPVRSALLGTPAGDLATDACPFTTGIYDAETAQVAKRRPSAPLGLRGDCYQSKTTRPLQVLILQPCQLWYAYALGSMYDDPPPPPPPAAPP